MIGDILYNIFITPLELIFEVIFYALSAYPAYAILGISIVMNFLALPLYMRADAITEEERKKTASMADRVEKIKKAFKGDERYMMLTTYYREQHYKPIYALKSTFSLLLQIPFFIAAYHFLSNCSALNGASFLFLTDLGAPDQLLNFGSFSLNLMPIIMTLINVISSFIYLKGSTVREKIQTYGIAVIFLVLLYSSPSGLVLYWTLNQVFSVLKNIFMKLVKKRSTVNIFFSLVGVAVFVLLVASGLASTGKQILLAAIIGIIFQTPSIISLVKKLKKGETKPVRPLKTQLFVLGAVYISILLGIVIPMSVISSSPTEFNNVAVTPAMIVVSCFCMSAGFFIVWLGIYYYMSNTLVRNIFTYAVFILAGIFTLNFMVFSKELGTITTSLVYDDFPTFTSGELLLNLVCDAALAVALIFLMKYLNRIVSYVYMIIILGGIVLAAVNIFSTTRELREAQGRIAHLADSEMTERYVDNSDVYKPEDSILTLSTTGQNVMILMMDRAISGFIPYIFNEKPQLYEQFDGFTYYPNTVSFGCHTNFGTPPIFGGYEYTPAALNARDDVLLSDKQNEALLLMPTLFSEEGYQVSVCDPPYAGWSFYPPDYSIYEGMTNVSTHHTYGTYSYDVMEAFSPVIQKTQKRNFFMYSIMKVVPQWLHNSVYNEGNYLSTSSWTSLSCSYEFLYAYSVLYSLPRLTEVVDDDINTLFMIDNDTTHSESILQTPEYEPVIEVTSDPYADMDRFTLNGVTCLNMNDEYNMGHYHANVAAYLKLGEWFDYLKEMGVYDNTRIIIVSDHGHELGNFEDLLVSEDNDAEWLNSVLLVKDFGATGPLQTSDEFMMTADVPTIAMDGLIEDPVNPFTGNPVNSDVDKEEQMVTTSHHWDIRDYMGTTYDLSDGSYWKVHGNVHDPSGWERVEE